MKSIYCPNCGWRQRKNVTMTSYSGNGHHDIVYSFKCEYCDEKVRAELQDTKVGDLI